MHVVPPAIPDPGIFIPEEPHPTERLAAEDLASWLGASAPHAVQTPGDGLNVAAYDHGWFAVPEDRIGEHHRWMWARIGEDGRGELTASHPHLVFALAHLLRDGLTEAQVAALPDGLFLPVTFGWHRPLFDYTLTQSARTARGFDAGAYLRHLARCGFTHAEVNGLASPVPLEHGVPGEFYPPFYTYCPALDQFVESDLTRGLYPATYLASNLDRLRQVAALARNYGLSPGLLCFEPRALPEPFFDRYPTLRGARVDHPFRSHRPRYTLAQDHPATRAHYAQLVRSLMREVPDLAYLSIWTNDSGAGFEHTASLYVGRNGGPYLIREWRTHQQIAEAAGRSALRFLRLLRSAAAEVNPAFEVSLRIEPFKAEHDTLMAGMGDGLTIEAPSLLVRGYELPYHHPRYPAQTSAAGTLFHTALDHREAKLLATHRESGFEPSLTYAPGPAFNLEPLLGIPFPHLLHARLTALKDAGVVRLAAMGGLLHPEKTPYWPNAEVIRAVQLNPSMPLDEVLQRAAERWTEGTMAGALVSLWEAVDVAVSWLPIVPLYSHFGFVWLRTWVRPLVPDIEAIPRAERAYYERFLVGTANNPNVNDLGRDVLFELINEDSGRRMKGQLDTHALPRIAAALETAERLATQAEDPARAVFIDLLDRLRALQCWAVTQRNTCAWVASVYGYLRTDDTTEQQRFGMDAREMVASELANTHALLDLWETSTTEFMLVSATGETSFIYGENMGELLREKIRLMKKYGDHEPAIDPEILWRL